MLHAFDYIELYSWLPSVENQNASLAQRIVQDFPYHMEEGIEHFILWSTSPMEKVEIERYVEREMPGFEYLWFVNPVELRSVLDVRMSLFFIAASDSERLTPSMCECAMTCLIIVMFAVMARTYT